jgi:hypothetical protein
MEKGKTIYFKSGNKISVSQEVVNILQANIISGNCAPFQTFTDDNNNCTFIINLAEIDYII